MKKGVHTCLLVLLVNTLTAQTLPDPVFHSFETEQLGVNKALHQNWDNQGRLWAATDKGLLRYDGYKSLILHADKNNTNSPLSDKLRSMLRADENEFWLTYADRNDISTFDPISGIFRHFYADTLNPHGYPNAQVTKIIIADDSTRWVLTWGSGLCRLNITNGFCTVYRNDDSEISAGEPPVNIFKDMIKIADDKYLVGFFYENHTAIATPHYFTPSTGRFEKMDLEPALAKHDKALAGILKKALTIVNFIYLDNHGIHWFGTYIGMVRFDPSKQTLERITGEHNDIYLQNLENTRAFVTDQHGHLWVTTPNQGILLIDTETNEVRYLRHQLQSENSLVDDRLASIAVDPKKNIWVATESGTFNICNPLFQNFRIHPWPGMGLDFTDRSLQQIPVNQILVLPDGDILISSATGIVRYNPTTRQSQTELKSLTHESLIKNGRREGIGHFKIIGDNIFFSRSVWGNAFQLMCFNRISKKTIIFQDKLLNSQMLFRHYNDTLTPMAFFSYWSGGRITAYNPVSKQMDTLCRIPDTIGFKENFSLILKSGKWMIPTSSGGFVLLDKQTGILDLYHRNSATHHFPDSNLNCAYLDASGMVWLGSNTALYHFDEGTEEITRCNEKLGLRTEEKVNSITQDKNGIFWIFLAKEMVRWDPEHGTAFRFNRSHGLNPGSFLPAVAQYDSSGNVYVACYNGILTFNPDEVLIPENHLQLYLSHVQLYEEELAANDWLTKPQFFSNEENFFTFEFYTNEVFTLTPNTFYYRLQGRDESWQDNGISNRIRLADLGPGTYLLEVKAVNTFGHESNILQLHFEIAQPFWLTWWFILIVVIIIGCIVWIYIRYREGALRKRSIELERTVNERTADVVREKREADKQRQEAEHQKEIVEEKNKEIADSINYAKRIQNAILPSNRFFSNNLPQSFILYLPKDIVAGDFYFMEVMKDTIILAVADCTGHGVPGAMVSVVCHNALTRSVKEFMLTKPNEILDKTRELVLETFANSEDQVNDGMDIAICSINRKTNTMLFAGANNGLFLIRRNELLDFKPDKQPIGKFILAKPFSAQEIALQKGDQFYLYSDGYADQFGGEEGKPGGKKFKYSRLKTLLQEIHLKPAAEQRDMLLDTLLHWRGEIEQIDDICIIGFKVD